MDSAYQHLVDVLTDKFESTVADMNPRTTLAELELDSLAVVELFITLQDHYGVELDDSQARPEMSLKDIVSLIRAQLNAEGRAERL
ncbi:acyl carrier protein [Streptomyces sp. ISL-11]|uniref:acyl carrier protein n=1 Tax=Streptomyces sp. ISL-11 TaxID=2819174 RepID=UPI001BE7900A|nr:acyl carrier protein [Streptomyces sp. ISL-11]MBT2384960.1 acyl carrier protein [Streptomyces sp. ISL-11]